MSLKRFRYSGLGDLLDHERICDIERSFNPGSVMHRVKISFLILLLSTSTHAQESYSILADKTFSTTTGVENLLTIDRVAYTFENRLLLSTWFNENTVAGKTMGISYRLGKTVLLDAVFDEYVSLVQHEVYGHGARAREYGASDITYSLNLSFPYGSSLGVTSCVFPPDKPMSSDQVLLFDVGGVEANAMLSKHLVLNWLQRGAINYRETLLYTRASNDLTQYLWRTKWGIHSAEGNDMLAYEADINQREGHFDPSDYKITVNDLAKQVLVIGLDPFQYYSLYTYFESYLYSAQETFAFPMIELGSFKYLPSFHLGLTPFGSEVYFENYFVHSAKVGELYFRYGIPTFHRSWGIGFYGTNIIESDPFSFDIGANVWNQPVVSTYDYNVSESKGGLGGSMSCTAYLKLAETFATVCLMGEVETKTMGYVQGEPLSDAMILRVGLRFIPR